MKRIKTKYPGVYYREVQRIGGNGLERVYYIMFKRDGRKIEEKVGYQYRNDMTPSKAARIRAERIEGRRPSLREAREQKRAEEAAQKARPTLTRLWEEYKTGRSFNKGLQTDGYRFEKHIAPAFGDKTPEELVQLDFDRLRIRLLKSYSPQTVSHVIRLVLRLIRFGVRRQLCKPLSFEPEVPRVNNLVTENLSPEQLGKLLKVLDSDKNVQVARMLKLALYTGMRRGEIFKLQWSDLDFERGFITLRSPKGGQDQTIPMNGEARRLLQEHISLRESGSVFVFQGRNGRMRTDVKKAARSIKKSAGLPDHFRAFHGLRHVYASLLASSGEVDMYTLQKLLTHKSSKMTQRYSHLRDESLRRAADLAGQLVEKAYEVTQEVTVDGQTG